MGTRPAMRSSGTAIAGSAATLIGPFRSVNPMIARPPTAPQRELPALSQAAPFAPNPMSSRIKGPQDVMKYVATELERKDSQSSGVIRRSSPRNSMVGLNRSRLELSSATTKLGSAGSTRRGATRLTVRTILATGAPVRAM